MKELRHPKHDGVPILIGDTVWIGENDGTPSPYNDPGPLKVIALHWNVLEGFCWVECSHARNEIVVPQDSTRTSARRILLHETAQPDK